MCIETFDKNCNEEELKDILQKYKLIQHNKTNGLILRPGVDINLVGRDSDGNVVCGIMCNTYLLIMYINVLWVHESYQGQGLNHRLIKEAEKIAKEAGCIYAHTSTYSFQSPDFYELHGYEAYDIDDYFPDNICLYSFKKKL